MLVWTHSRKVGFSGTPRMDLWSNFHHAPLTHESRLPPFSYDTWDYAVNRFPLIEDPPYPTVAEERWVAVFVTRDGIVFVPVLNISSWDSDAAAITVTQELLSVGQLHGKQMLIISKEERRSYCAPIIRNTGTVLYTLPITGYTIEAADFVVVAPADTFTLQTILRVDAIDTLGFEWRNFTHAGNKTYSLTSVNITNVTSTVASTRDFSNMVSPLASGIILKAQVYYSAAVTPGAEPTAALFCGRDSSHFTADIGLNRCPVINAGVFGMLELGFPLDKALYFKVNIANAVGVLQCMGWIE